MQRNYSVVPNVVLFLSGSPFRPATALLGKYYFSSFNSRFSISTGMVQKAFVSLTVRKKIFGQVEQRGKTDLPQARRGPFRNLLPVYDNLDTLDRML